MRATLLCVCLTAVVSAQAPKPELFPNGLRVLHIEAPEATEVSIVVALPIGWHHDPADRTGCAEVMRWFLSLSQRDELAGQRFLVEALPRHTLLSHNGPRRDAVDRLAFVHELLAGKIDVTEDLHAVALGRARLESDNHSWLYPGSVIRQKAWRTLLRGAAGGRQSFGVPDEMARIDRETMRRRYVDHYGCSGAVVVVLGDIRDDSGQDGWKAWCDAVRKLPAAAGVPRPVVHDSAPPMEAIAVHERVDGPYVTAAIPALPPKHPDYLAFVAASLVLRDEAQLQFGRFRGMEWRAGSPFIAFEYRKGDQLLRINRRGRNYSVPGPARREIEEFLARMRKHGARRGQLDAVRVELANTFGVPPFANSAGPFLAVRARFMATALCLDWPLNASKRVGEVRLEDVNRVLRERLAPSQVRWFALKTTRRRLPRGG